MRRRNKNKKANFTYFNPTQAMVDMHATKIIFLEGILSDFSELLLCHRLIGCILNSGYGLILLVICPNLAKKNIMCPYSVFGLMLGNSVCYKFRRNSTFYKYFYLLPIHTFIFPICKITELYPDIELHLQFQHFQHPLECKLAHWLESNSLTKMSF